ncbi:MAG: hypothetical protein DMG65_09715 [Candidatus Angelobacter sp. Gp1-AA117]|nr:MAG: hypothetical protein DMG65_09715 [Candidatus Angelobacter sp. Gp1-AA117]
MFTTPSQDTEITLGTGKLLGIFFGLVILCAVFFTLGYMLGHSGSPSGATTLVTNVPNSGTPANKPAAGRNTEAVPAATPVVTQPAAGTPPDTSAATPAADATKTQDQNDSARNTPPEFKAAGNGTYMVQVAAVSKQEDAEILGAALRKKQYPVLVVSNVAGDSLFHVQVGPFNDQKEAESMRSRLASDGYNAIVKAR